MSQLQCDVAVIGGGATGCAAAYFLKQAGVARVCVIEPDPTDAKASTPVDFESVVWPACASRIPAFEGLKLKREWAGLYDECELDGNMILGNWPGKLGNFFVACGFSGHGLMHAPAVGRALAELIVKGRYETIDLTRLSFQRVLDNAPYREIGII